MMRGLYGRVMNYEEDETEEKRMLQESESLYVMIEKNFTNVFMSMFKLVLLVSLPFISFVFIQNNKEKLADPDFQRRYGTLYQNLNVNSDSVYWFNFYFCLRRFIIGAFTIFMNDVNIVNIYIDIFTSLFMIRFIFDH